jgi:amidohydrolase
MDTRMIETLKRQAGATIDAHAGALRQISLDLRNHPEVGWAEEYAAGRLSDYLEAQRFTLERGIGGLDTAFRAAWDSGTPGPTIAVIAEYDALPDVGHGCGHNLIAAGAVGAGLGVQAVLDRLGGRVLVLGTPAEEFTNQLQGKIKLLRAGEFAGIDACLMFHPWPVSAPIQSSLAFVSMDLVFHGQTAHAAADPWNGLNALDGVIMTFNHISALRQHVQPDVRIHGIITDGGVAPNIIPERAAARFMLRARQRERVQDVLDRVRACAEGAAAATGTRVEISVNTEAADTVAYPTLQALTRANYEMLGEPFEAPIDWTASTDFGDVSYVIPSESFFITLGAGDLTWHSTAVADAVTREPALHSMLVGAKVLAMDAIDLLASPALLERARGERPAAG